MRSAASTQAGWCVIARTVSPVRRDSSLQVVADRQLGFGIERTGRFVEDHEFRAMHDGARDGDALALSTGEQRAAFADHAVHALRQLLDEIPGAGGHERRPNGRVIELRIAERDIQ